MREMALPRRVFGIPPILILIFFLLPWMTVSCSGDGIGTFSGLQLATGSVGQDVNESFQSVTGSGFQGDWRVVVVLVAALAALVVVFALRPFNQRLYGMTGVVALVFLLWHFIDISGQAQRLSQENGVSISIVLELGWWLTGLMILAIIGLGLYLKPPLPPKPEI